MNINAKYFGEISYEKEEIIHINNGLFGFESYTEYLPLSFDEENDTMLSLQSIEDESLSFILLNPFKFFPNYNPELSDQDKKDLSVDSEEHISYYVIGVIRDSLSDSTVNLKAPLAVNTLTRQAKQAMLENPEYTFRHKFENAESKEEL